MPTDERPNEELSAEIAERLFPCPSPSCPYASHQDQPYASDHNAALGLVVPAMLARPGIDSFECGVTKSGSWAVFRRGHGPGVAGYAEADEGLPRAICLAALAALDAERKAE